VSLKIIGGQYKGRVLEIPKSPGIRPTASLVREALFSILDQKINNSIVLVLFAGSGSLGLEALSRGAAKAIFCDRSPLALKSIKKNINNLHTAIDETIVLKLFFPNDFKTLLKFAPYDLVLIDPPYSLDTIVLNFLIFAKNNNILNQGAVVVWEQAPKTLKAWKADDVSPFQITLTRRWGDRAAAVLTLE